jgi:hypothetical protein
MNTVIGKKGCKYPSIGLSTSGDNGWATANVIRAFASAPPKNPMWKTRNATADESDIEVAQRGSRLGETHSLMIVRATDIGRKTTQSLFETSRLFKSLPEPMVKKTAQVTVDKRSRYVNSSPP